MIYDNGIYRELTAEEKANIEAKARLAAIIDRTRPLTIEEVSSIFISQQINTLTVDDNMALRMKNFYPEWVAGVSYEPGFKVRRNNKLWRVIQAHTSQITWEPENAQSLWAQIDEIHDGTIDDPIPYEGNMILTADKYYYQNHVMYLCNRDSGNPVYHALSDLVGIYVEVV